MAVSTAARPTPVVVVDAFDAITAGVGPDLFPSRDDVASVAALVESTVGVRDRVDLADGGHLSWLGVSPGTVSIRLDHRHGMHEGDGLSVDPLELAANAASPGTDPDPQGVLFDVDEDAGKRGRITEWSAGSRRRMHRTIAELDLSQWSDTDGTLCMVTLTLPGWWECYVPTGAHWKRLIESLRLRWRREVRTPWRGLWKMEFQERGAPHQHMLMRVPAMVGTGDRARTFETWLAETWADVCLSSVDERTAFALIDLGHADLHIAHGTDLSWSGVKFSDPRRTSVYFGKHSTKNRSKEYQNVVPALWQDEGAGPGRFWGVWGLRRAVVEVLLDRATMHRARRILRHVAKARAAATAHSRLRAAALDDAAFRADLAAMPRQHVRSLTTGGGWVLVNDGLGLALALRRALSQP